MDASHETEDTADSVNEDEEKGSNEQLVRPAYLNTVLRRQFLNEMVKCLPAKIQNRLVALKNLQLQHLHLEAQFFDEVYQLEKKYQDKYYPLFEKRREIISGEVEPPKTDPDWKEVKEDEDEEHASDKAAIESLLKKVKEIPEDTKGIPNFWLTVFRNSEILSEMVQDHDEPVLQKLTDITIKYDEKPSYVLEFHFDKNEYFSNSVLTKQYFLRSRVDDNYPFTYEGPEIYKCKGCDIHWEKKMNLTVKTIRKKQKHKERGAVRTVVKQVPNDSFFNFFNPPQVPEGKEDEVDDDSQGVLATDYEIGHFLRARIIPKAVLYYTGDVIDDEDEEDESYNGDEEEEEDDDDDDDSVDGNINAV